MIRQLPLVTRHRALGLLRSHPILSLVAVIAVLLAGGAVASGAVLRPAAHPTAQAPPARAAQGPQTGTVRPPMAPGADGIGKAPASPGTKDKKNCTVNT